MWGLAFVFLRIRSSETVYLWIVSGHRLIALVLGRPVELVVVIERVIWHPTLA